MKEFTPEQRQVAKEIEDYVSIFVSAWDRFLTDLKRGKTIPTNEAEMRSLLFSHCLVLLRRRKFSTPYEIGAEDIEVYGGERADLTLGYLGEQRCVVVEMKHFPGPDSIREDIAKLRKFIEENKFAVGYFVMIGRKGHISLDLTQLDFSEEDYIWEDVDSSFADEKFQTLIVRVRAKDQNSCCRKTVGNTEAEKRNLTYQET